MSFRSYLERLQSEQRLQESSVPISRHLEISGVLKKLEPQPVLFHSVEDNQFRVAGNLFCTKASFADYFHVSPNEIISLLTNAINHPSRPEVVSSAECQQVVMLQPDLNKLPLLFHCTEDGGRYISSGVVVTRHPKFGQNLDFHRCMQFSTTEMAMRIVRSRHFDTYFRDVNQLEVAICIGNSPAVMAAAATSVELGRDELTIANALEPTPIVKAISVNLFVPAESEFVIEGIVRLNNTHPEGPFVDLTETLDIIRQEPVFEIRAITHRADAIWHALLPGGLEHKLLMGMPREPTIFNKVNQVVRCLDVNINPGGCSWLHAIVQIDKQNEDDGKKAILAAFEGHKSCKHVFVVDNDIDIYDPLSVEWAFATRFQGDQDLVYIGREPGSSLDPSSESDQHLTMKIGFDLTKPLVAHGKTFNRIAFPDIDLNKYF